VLSGLPFIQGADVHVAAGFATRGHRLLAARLPRRRAGANPEGPQLGLDRGATLQWNDFEKLTF
jgi:hypothetical protein